MRCSWVRFPKLAGRRGVRRDFWSATLTLLCLFSVNSATATGRAPLRLQRSGERLYLRQGAERLLLEGREERTVPGPEGRALVLSSEDFTATPSVRIIRHGKPLARLSLDQVREQWLKQDALWGSGKAGNQMRYMHQSAGGVRGFLYEAYPTAKGWIGVLTWRFGGPSGEPVGAQHLVYIPADQPEIQPVRLLRGGKGEAYATPASRLFRYAGRLLLWEPGELTELGPRGEPRRRFMEVPAESLPHSLLGKRWLILQASEHGTQIDAADLLHESVRPLLREPPVERGYRSTTVRGTDSATLMLLLQSSGDAESANGLSLLSLRTRSQRSIPKKLTEHVSALWHGLLIVRDDPGYTLYDARTFRPVKRLPHPGKQP